MANPPPNGPAKAEAHGAAAAPAAPSSGGLKAWLPLLLSLLLMPALAYGLTVYILLPKLQHALVAQAAAPGESGGGETGEHGEKPGAGHESGKGKTKVPFNKIVVNVSGSLGARLLLTSLTLVGTAKDFKDKVEDNTDQLRDIASNTLGSKTISDLEKPEARNLLRAELLSQFSSVLGTGFVQDIYITEMAIQ